jgi:DNA polymerase eta
MGIGAFLVKKDEANVLDTSPAINETGQERPEKRRRIEPSTGIERFFKMDSTDEHDDEFGSQYLPGIDNAWAEIENADSKEKDKAASSNLPRDEASECQEKLTLSRGPPATHQQHITDYMCDRCSMALESADALQSHQDWHFAKDLEHEERTQVVPKHSGAVHNKKATGTASKKKGARSSKPEKGQSKLAFR